MRAEVHFPIQQYLFRFNFSINVLKIVDLSGIDRINKIDRIVAAPAAR